MELSFVLPIWAIAAFAATGYSAGGYAVGRYVKAHSKGNWPTPVIALASLFWPLTLAATFVIYPIWANVWLFSNYNEGIKRFLASKIFPEKAPKIEQVIRPGSVVELIEHATEFSSLSVGSKGTVTHTSHGQVTAHWTTPDGRTFDGYVYAHRLRVIA